MNDENEKEIIDVDIVSETLSDVGNMLDKMGKFANAIEEVSPNVAKTAKKAEAVGKKSISVIGKAKALYEKVKANTRVKERPIIPR